MGDSLWQSQHVHRAFLEVTSGAIVHQIERGSVMVDKGR